MDSQKTKSLLSEHRCTGGGDDHTWYVGHSDVPTEHISSERLHGNGADALALSLVDREILDRL